jgi:hypothetical protein
MTFTALSFLSASWKGIQDEGGTLVEGGERATESLKSFQTCRFFFHKGMPSLPKRKHGNEMTYMTVTCLFACRKKKRATESIFKIKGSQGCQTLIVATTVYTHTGLHDLESVFFLPDV